MNLQRKPILIAALFVLLFAGVMHPASAAIPTSSSNNTLTLKNVTDQATMTWSGFNTQDRSLTLMMVTLFAFVLFGGKK